MPTIPTQIGNFVFEDRWEAIGGPNKMFAPDGSRVERPIQFNAGQWKQCRAAFMGYSLLASGSSPTSSAPAPYISRNLPHGWEDPQDSTLQDNQPWLWGYAVNRSEYCNPSTTDPGSGAPRSLQKDRAVILYTHRTYRPLTDNAMLSLPFVPTADQDSPLGGFPDEANLQRYVTKRPRPYSRTIALPHTLPQWVLEDGDKAAGTAPNGTPIGPPLGEPGARKEDGLDLEYIHHEVPSDGQFPPEPCVGLDTIGKALNTVNKYPFDGYEAGTLLCLVPDIRCFVDVMGQFVFDVHYHFRYLPKPLEHGVTGLPRGTKRGHNALLRWILRASGSNILDYRYVSADGTATGDRIYPSSDFSKLFRPRQPF